MAPRPTAKDLKTRDQLVAAAAKLRAIGQPALADAVDLVLSPKGRPLLDRLRAEKGDSAKLQPNFAIGMPRHVREHIKKAAAAAGDDLTDQVTEGLRRFVAGTFEPPMAQRQTYGSGPDRVNLNLRPSESMRAQADALGAELEDQLGWRPRASTVAVAWLLHQYPMPKSARAE